MLFASSKTVYYYQLIAIIDREFEFYEFLSFLKFYEFYEFFFG